MGFGSFLQSLPCFEAEEHSTLTRRSLQAKNTRERLVRRNSSDRPTASRPRHDTRHRDINSWSVRVDGDEEYNDRPEGTLVEYDELTPPLEANEFTDRRRSAPVPLGTRGPQSSRMNSRPQQQQPPSLWPPPLRSAVQPTPIMRYMNPATVNEVIAYVGRTFGHVPYVICGLSAMVHYGFRARQPVKVSVLCPAYVAKPIKAWACSSGMTRVPGRPGTYGVTMPDGAVRYVCFKFLEHGFDRLETVHSGLARVLTLPGLADRIAVAYVRELVTASSEKQRVFAEDMMWCLHNISRTTSQLQAFSKSNVDYIARKEFWFPFLLSFPNLEKRFQDAGIRVVGDGHDRSPEVEYIVYLPKQRRDQRDNKQPPVKAEAGPRKDKRGGELGQTRKPPVPAPAPAPAPAKQRQDRNSSSSTRSSQPHRSASKRESGSKKSHGHRATSKSRPADDEQHGRREHRRKQK